MPHVFVGTLIAVAAAFWIAANRIQYIQLFKFVLLRYHWTCCKLQRHLVVVVVADVQVRRSSQCSAYKVINTCTVLTVTLLSEVLEKTMISWRSL